MKLIKKADGSIKHGAEYVADNAGNLILPKFLTGLELEIYNDSLLPEYRMEHAKFYKRVVVGHKIISVLMLRKNQENAKIIIGKAEKAGYNYIPLISDAKNGLFHFYHNDIPNPIDTILTELDILQEWYKMGIKKAMNRLTKLMGRLIEITYKPRIFFVSGGVGYVTARESWAKRNGIEHGAKLVGTMKSIIVVVPDSYFDNVILSNYDMIVPEDENKFKLTAEKLANSIFLNDVLAADRRFSKNLLKGLDADGNKVFGKNPRFSLQLRAICNDIPKPDYDKVVKFYTTGEYDAKFLFDLFGYIDSKTGEHKLKQVGLKIMGTNEGNGMSPFDPAIWKEVDLALGAYVKRLWIGRIPGVYGTALPLSILPDTEKYRIKEAYVFRAPIMVPVYSKYAIYKHCIYVQDDLWDKVFHGDYDGDLAFVIHKKFIKSPANWLTNSAKLSEWAKAPSKDESTEHSTILSSTEDIMEQAKFCGIAHNNSKIVLDMGRMFKMTDEQALQFSLYLDMKYVQPTIDAFKHTMGSDLEDISTMITDLRKFLGQTDKCYDPSYTSRRFHSTMAYKTVNGKNVSFTKMLLAIEKLKVRYGKLSFNDRVLSTIPVLPIKDINVADNTTEIK